MLEYILTGIIAINLLLLYVLINKPGIASRMLRRALRRDTSGKRNKIYMERFREHKESHLSRNLIVQILPWLGVLALVFILGSQYFVFATVLSGSMEPTFKRGDLVLMQTFETKAGVGDIIMFPMYGIKEPITHRVVNITETGNIITKGDANPATDTTQGFPPERVAGKAVLIGNKPIVLEGLGYNIRPENIGPVTVLAKLPKSFVIAQAFQQFRTLQPLIIFFATIFYFFMLMESRMEYNRRFGNGKNGRSNEKSRTKGP